MMPLTLHNTSIRTKCSLPLILFISSILLLQACTSETKFTGTSFCPAYLSEGDQILVNALSFETLDFKLDLLRNETKKSNVKLRYAPEEEYTLRAAGIQNPLDTSSYASLLQKGITHLLLIHETSYQRGSLMAYKTAYELSLQYNSYLPYALDTELNGPKTQIQFHLISLKTKQSYSFMASTQGGGFQVQGKQGGATTFNSSIERARNVALKKGMNRIVKNCL